MMSSVVAKTAAAGVVTDSPADCVAGGVGDVAIGAKEFPISASVPTLGISG